MTEFEAELYRRFVNERMALNAWNVPEDSERVAFMKALASSAATLTAALAAMTKERDEFIVKTIQQHSALDSAEADNDELRAEVANLTHDIERRIAIASSEAEAREIEREHVQNVKLDSATRTYKEIVTDWQDVPIVREK